MFGCEENDSLVLNDFLTGVGQLKFRGTSLLLRSEQSAFAALKVTTVYCTVDRKLRQDLKFFVRRACVQMPCVIPFDRIF